MTLPRKLAYKDKFVFKLVQEIDDDCAGNEIVFPDNETPIKFIVEMNLLEATKLLSALMTGADLSYPNEAHDVVWIWLRQLECPVSICDELIECLTPLFEALEAQISSVSDSISAVSETLDNNTPVVPAGIPADTSGNICSGASFVVEFMDFEIRRVYAEAEEGLLDNLIEAAVEILRAIPVIESLPIDELINVVNLMFENQVADYITDYDAIYDDLIGSLSCFIVANSDVFDIDVWAQWLEFIGAEYPTNRAALLFAAFSPLKQSFLSDILAGIFNRPTLAQWFELIMLEYTAGIQGTITCPTYECPECGIEYALTKGASLPDDWEECDAPQVAPNLIDFNTAGCRRGTLEFASGVRSVILQFDCSNQGGGSLDGMVFRLGEPVVDGGGNWTGWTGGEYIATAPAQSGEIEVTSVTPQTKFWFDIGYTSSGGEGIYDNNLAQIKILEACE